MADFDLAVIGGGINGAGIARDAAGRGIGVLLIEQQDLASGTSSASTKLIHGGLRYLEHGQLRLVRKSLREREILLRLAPHIIHPMRFVLPHHAAMRPAWMLRLGLFAYDHLGGTTSLPGTRVLDLASDPSGIPLKRILKLGFEYSDCWVDDSRLVVLNAIDAHERGAVIRTRTRLVRADREDGKWRLVLNARGRREIVTARVLVNAAGPWVSDVAQNALRAPPPPHVRFVKGSHVVVRRLFAHDRAYIFQNADRRVVFAIPYERDFTLIGTTDQDFAGEPGTATTTPSEITYLCEAVSIYLRSPVTPYDVVHAFSGVRTLVEDAPGRAAADLTRDYSLILDLAHEQPPLLTVYGGKITTYRRLAEEALDRIAGFFAARGSWTADEPLPGGDFAAGGRAALAERAREQWPFLSEDHAIRLVGAYGTRVADVIGEARSLDAMGPRFSSDLTTTEVRYLMQQEWAQTADDVLWRRSKLGLRFTAQEKTALGAYMEGIGAAAPVE